MKPMTSSKGISSQTNGAQQLSGSYAKHPAPVIGKNSSHEMDAALGSKTGGDKLGEATARKSK